jgi:hypothetical protein
MLDFWESEKRLLVVVVSVWTFGEVASIEQIAELDWDAFRLIVGHSQPGAHVRPLLSVPGGCENFEILVKIHKEKSIKFHL